MSGKEGGEGGVAVIEVIIAKRTASRGNRCVRRSQGVAISGWWGTSTRNLPIAECIVYKCLVSATPEPCVALVTALGPAAEQPKQSSGLPRN